MDEEDWIKAGSIAKQVRNYGAGLIKIDASLLDVTEQIEKKIKELDAKPAFPPQISLNEIAAHYCPDKNDTIIFKEGDVAKIDIGIEVNGAIGDTATTVDLGNNQKLINASQDALKNALEIIKPGTQLQDIGKIVEKAIQNNGFTPIRNLSGHGLARYQIHTSPSIPNYNNKDKTILEENQNIAIEPFATNGGGWIFADGNVVEG